MSDAETCARKGSGLPLSGQALLGLMREVVSRGGALRFRAAGCSMTPFIRDGDVIVVAPSSGARPAVGDVVAFRSPSTGTLAVHRVVARRGAACLVRGDNTRGGFDGLIPPEGVLGRVTRIERGGRRVRLGLGPEKLLVALLSRTGLLRQARRALAPLLRPFRRTTR